MERQSQRLVHRPFRFSLSFPARPKACSQAIASVGVSRDNVVYAASSDKFLYALHDNDGSVIWKFQTGAAIVASPSLFPEHTMPVG